MSSETPPRWLETILLWSLPPRSRETVSGDLLEEYRDGKRPSLGVTRANFWYLRQTLSFLVHRSFGGSPMRAILAWLCSFTVLAGIWLALMEQLLRHGGYVQRTLIATAIAIQGLATVVLLMAGRRSRLFAPVAGGAVALGIFAITAIIRTLQGPHFEGFVLVIGVSLILQAILTSGVFLNGESQSR